MTKQKSTKRALLLSALSLLMCVSMLIGSTFAWFTDSVTSGNNKIIAGNLDVELYHSDKTATDEKVSDTTKLFDDVTLWEPGAMVWEKLTVKNLGSLALKYTLTVNVSDVSIVNGKSLADVLQVAVMTAQPTRENIVTAEKQKLETFSLNSDKVLAAKNGVDEFYVAIYWAPSANDNDYNVADEKLYANLGVTLVATQATVESDSFDDQYDKDAEYPEIMDVWDGTADTSWYNTTDKTFTLSTAEELAGLSVLSANGNTFSGKTIVLDSSMDLDGKQWTPIKQFSGTFDGGEHTVSNFTLDGTSGRAGFIQNLGQYPATVKNLTLSEVNGIAGSKQYFGILAANGHTSILENVHIVDSKITTTNKEAWVGGVYGYFNWTSATNCTVENLVIDATGGAMFIGGFSGNMDQDLSIDNVDIIGLKITVDATNGACQVGGFTGQTQTGHRQPTFNNCDVTGLDIVAKGEVQLGGFVGDAGAHTIANNCTVEGKIDASGVIDDRSFIGGFIADSGWNNNESNKGGHKLTNCSADVDIITGGSTAGGFIGSTTAYHSDGGNRNMPITMTNCKATGTVTVANGATATIGGFAGEAERGTFKNCSTTSNTFIGKIWDGYTLNDDGNGTLTVTK
ncbi:MAG: hypothetical protein J6C92_00655 [Bacteroidaceae bacterium]|nr:hypothetical protein [Bacteroidaceae bacterium]